MEQIRPPRVPFVDPKSGIISREWYRWLMLVTNAFDDSDVSGAFDSITGISSVAEAEKGIADVSLNVQFPYPIPSQSRDIDDVRLLDRAIVPQTEVEEVRLLDRHTTPEITEARLQDLMLLSWLPSTSITDHGLMTGLTDDDHTQYLLVNGTRGLSAAWDAGSWQIRAETFQSDVATGTAPLTVASTTKVTNLNADLLDDQTGSYYLDSANFTGTNWTDLTDSGATTLHKHDHGGQDGLTDDDHTQYWNSARGAARVSLGT